MEVNIEIKFCGTWGA